MSSHTQRYAASELPVKRISDGVLLVAAVEFIDQGPQESVTSNGSPYIDLKRGDFKLNLALAGRHYSATGEWGSTTLEKMQKALEEDGYEPRCCFTCQHYWSSGMFDEWSFGTEGYCNLRGEPTMDDLTHMLHICQHWSQERPFLLIDQSERTRLVLLYKKAFSAVKSDSKVMQDVFRARVLNPHAIEPEVFMREYAWAVFNSGMKMEIIIGKWPSLERIFKHWDYNAICQSKSLIRKEALLVFNHPGKIEAVLHVADYICKNGWAAVRGAISAGIMRSANSNIYPSRQFFDYVRKLPRPNWMGPTNSRFLAKNLGFDLAKDDRHMKRLASQNGYPANAQGVQCFVEKISQCVGERVSVVETVLWNACKVGAI